MRRPAFLTCVGLFLSATGGTAVARTLTEASEVCNLTEVTRAIADGADVNALNSLGFTPLLAAAESAGFVAPEPACREVELLLLEKGANPNGGDVATGEKALHYAARHNQATVADALIKHGAPVDAVGRNGLTPLYYAASTGSYKVAKLLLERGAAPGGQGSGKTPLKVARDRKDIKMIALLRARGTR